MKDYRIKRPAEFDSLLNLLKDKDSGIFDTLKSSLVFAAVVGFANNSRLKFTDTSEPIPLRLFSEEQDLPIMYLLSIAEYGEIDFLKESKFEQVISLFEEYAAGGLQYLDREMDKNNVKEYVESMLFNSTENQVPDLMSDITSI